MIRLFCRAKMRIFCCAVAALLFVGCGGGNSSGNGAVTFTLTIEANPDAGGTVSPGGNIKYSDGATVEVTATAADGYRFTGWSGASKSQTNAVTVIMNSNQTLTANFQEVVTGSFADSRDGKKYGTIKMGGKTWMAQNLNFKTANSWCYENNTSNCAKYGRLYTWDAAMKACPSGWRLPTRGDWADLVAAAGGNAAGTKLKAGSPDWNGKDVFGFSALPGGCLGTFGDFKEVGSHGNWWSATEFESGSAYYRGMSSGRSFVDETTFSKGLGFSALCVQD